LEAFIIEFRNDKHKPTMFQEVQWLAERWKRRPLKPIRKRWWRF
jgi:hypothetical protein